MCRGCANLYTGPPEAAPQGAASQSLTCCMSRNHLYVETCLVLIVQIPRLGARHAASLLPAVLDVCTGLLSEKPSAAEGTPCVSRPSFYPHRSRHAGTAAEILDDRVRQELCPDKLRTQPWLQVTTVSASFPLHVCPCLHVQSARPWDRPPHLHLLSPAPAGTQVSLRLAAAQRSVQQSLTVASCSWCMA